MRVLRGEGRDRRDPPKEQRLLIGVAIVAVLGLGLLLPSLIAGDNYLRGNDLPDDVVAVETTTTDAPTTTSSTPSTSAATTSPTTTDPPAVHSPQPPEIVLLEPEEIPTPPPGRPAFPNRGQVLHVAPDGEDGDGSADDPFTSINAALAAAEPGDTIRVAEGNYSEYITTVRSGTPDAPIRIVADGNAHIEGDDYFGRLVVIAHSFVTLEGFELSGSDKLIWVEGATGTKIFDNYLHDAGGECLRLKFFATDSEIAGNRIEDCGIEGFDLDDDDKVGEGIYVGTAPEQLDRNPSDRSDRSDRNWIHHNTIDTPAECVEFKEGTSGNIADSNTCSGQRDPDGAGFATRGSGNIFYANEVDGAAGAGIRIGGDDDDDGVDNFVIANVLRDTEGPAIAIRRTPQALMCGNEVSDNDGGVIDKEDIDDPTDSCDWPVRPPMS